jgi:predicted nucleic acid-binding protein
LIAYLESSAALALYVEEPTSAEVRSVIRDVDTLGTSMLTQLEVMRNLHRLLDNERLALVVDQFLEDLQSMVVASVSDEVVDAAVTIAVATGVKSLDALHLSSALILGGIGAEFLTFDRRQADAARAVGLRVIGAN